jgi:hypothetical protein
LSYYDKAKAEGATIVTGGGIPDMPDDLKGGACEGGVHSLEFYTELRNVMVKY